MNATEICQEKPRFVSDRIWEDSEEFNTKEDLVMHIDERCNKLEDLRKCKTRLALEHVGQGGVHLGEST